MSQQWPKRPSQIWVYLNSWPPFLLLLPCSFCSSQNGFLTSPCPNQSHSLLRSFLFLLHEISLLLVMQMLFPLAIFRYLLNCHILCEIYLCGVFSLNSDHPYLTYCIFYLCCFPICLLPLERSLYQQGVLSILFIVVSLSPRRESGHIVASH